MKRLIALLASTALALFSANSAFAQTPQSGSTPYALCSLGSTINQPCVKIGSQYFFITTPGLLQQNGPVNDLQSAPYGLATAPVGSTLTPGSSTAATPGRALHIICTPAGTGTTVVTQAHGQQVGVTLPQGGDRDVAYAVTLVGTLAATSGTPSCTFANIN